MERKEIIIFKPFKMDDWKLFKKQKFTYISKPGYPDSEHTFEAEVLYWNDKGIYFENNTGYQGLLTYEYLLEYAQFLKTGTPFGKVERYLK